MSDILDIEGTVVGVGAALNNASGIGVEIEEDSTHNLITIAGLSRDQAKQAAKAMGQTVRIYIVGRFAD